MPERARALQAINLVEALLTKNETRYATILNHANPRDLAHELAYLCALLVGEVADDRDDDAAGQARCREVLDRLRERIRRDTETP